MRDQIAFCACHEFLVEVQANCWQHTCDACVIATWRLGLRAPLVARNYAIIESIKVNSFQYGRLWDRHYVSVFDRCPSY